MAIRELISHLVSGQASDLKIAAVDERGHGNANHEYVVTSNDENDDLVAMIKFQNGPVKEHGINGVTNEALLAVVKDRLEGFQSGSFACAENQTALEHVDAALDSLKSRTQKRLNQGVEGTSVQHQSE